MSGSELVLAIDGGGTHTRCLAVDTATHRVIGRGAGGPSNHLLVERAIVQRSLTTAIDEALASAGARRGDVACVAAGLAGVDFDGAGADDMEPLVARLGFSRELCVGDVIVAHHGALCGKPGVLVLAGTGSVVLGIGGDQKRAKVGGWGPVYGDEGSGHHIGRQALRAAARAHDGRGPNTALLDAMTTALGVRGFGQSISVVYGEHPMAPRDLAALTPIAYEVARSGDTVARQIFFDAADDLAEAAMAVIRRLDALGAAPLVSYQGGVLDSCELVRQRFVEALRLSLPAAVVHPPRLGPVFGAYLLGCRSLGLSIDDMALTSLTRDRTENDR
ncbi:MAG: N-acetylglucosamine kinase [Kofleriaceae bacterium]